MKITRISKHTKTVIRHILHSWWLGVGILLLISIGIALARGIAKQPANKVSDKPAAIESKKITEPTNHQYGVALGGQLNINDANKRSAILAQIKSAGFDEVRVSLDWVDAEPTQGKINWTVNDVVMDAIKKSGLKTVLLVDRVPAWARLSVCKTDPVCSPANSTDYATFIAAAAARYKNYSVAAWEIWNEENGNNFSKPLPNPNQYAQLLIASYKAIKAVNPQATVLIGGLSGDSVDRLGNTLIDPRTYLAELYAANVKDYFDGIAYHPYMGNGLPTNKSDYNGWLKMNSGQNSIRSIMTAHGDEDKKIWITEFGLPTGGKGAEVTDLSNPPKNSDHVSLDVENQIVQAVIDDIKQSPWIQNFDWYTYKDDTTATTYSGAAYGIWGQDGKAKPLLRVLQDASK